MTVVYVDTIQRERETLQLYFIQKRQDNVLIHKTHVVPSNRAWSPQGNQDDNIPPS